MKINMNGLRRNLTREFTELSEIIELISTDINDVYHLGERLNDLIEQHDKVAQEIGILNCVYDDDEDGFTDQSEILTVRFLTEE